MQDRQVGPVDTEAIDRAFADVGAAFGRVATTLGGYFDRAIPAIADAMNTVLVIMSRAYSEAGSPYGESNDGMLRWVRELGEARQHIDEAERILDRHRGLAEFRRAANARHIGGSDG